MPRKRRSGRIAKELAIVLLGTDATGKVFSEETNTVVLSRHGAGVVTRYRFSPDELLTLRLPGTAKEAAIRLVGQIGGEPGRYVYGVTFVDPDPDFWPMEFPPPDPFEPASQQIALECSMCQARMDIEQGDIEEDVYSVNGNILRYCDECGTSTPWKKVEGKILPGPLARPAKSNFITSSLTPAPQTSKPASTHLRLRSWNRSNRCSANHALMVQLDRRHTPLRQQHQNSPRYRMSTLRLQWPVPPPCCTPNL